MVSILSFLFYNIKDCKNKIINLYLCLLPKYLIIIKWVEGVNYSIYRCCEIIYELKEITNKKMLTNGL